jgi:hypothetical protein
LSVLADRPKIFAATLVVTSSGLGIGVPLRMRLGGGFGGNIAPPLKALGGAHAFTSEVGQGRMPVPAPTLESFLSRIGTSLFDGENRMAAQTQQFFGELAGLPGAFRLQTRTVVRLSTQQHSFS